MPGAVRSLRSASGTASGPPQIGRGDELLVAAARRLEETVGVAGTALRIRASAGVALGRGPGADLDGLLRDADLALYQAKAGGKGTVARHRRPDPHTRRDRPLAGAHRQ
jgi:predicted signal transduction protein with EAL and GGDEF domain